MALRRGPPASGTTKSSWFRRVLNGARVASAIWFAFAARGAKGKQKWPRSPFPAGDYAAQNASSHIRAHAGPRYHGLWINTPPSNVNIEMKQLIELSTAPEPLDALAGTLEVAPQAAPGIEPPPAPSSAAATTKTTPVQIVLIVLGTIAFLYFARPVVLPVVLACVAGVTLKPLIRWLSYCHIPPALGTAVVLSLLVAAVGIGFFQLGRPAMTWMNDAPAHMAQLRQRVQRMFPRVARFNQAADAVNNLGAAEEEKKKVTTVELKTSRVPSTFINWTGTFLAGVGEMLVLLYLLLASGDLFLQKLVHVMPTFREKKSAVEISHEIQQNISNYLFSVSLINIALGAVVSGGLYWLGVPNALMWGMLVAVLNFVPYFGPVAGIILLAAVGLLTFDTLWKGLLPPAWYLLLHLLEANLITPVLLGRRFTLNPVVIFVSLIFWTWLWGVPGALLSVPILVSIKVICDRVPSLSSVSELLAS
jgi:predicted PurR-regulated permease PerM